MIAAQLVAIGIGFIPIQRLETITTNRENAYDLLTQVLSNYGSFLGIGLAILAILFTIIQLAYRRLSIIELVIEHSFFIPLFYFAIFNVGISSMLLPFRHSGDWLSDFIYHRMALIESTLFYVFVFAEAVVFYRTIKVMNFSHILELYLNDTASYTIKESRKSISKFEESVLYDRDLELRAEMTHVISEGQTRSVNRIMLHYFSLMTLNPAAILLTDFDRKFAGWYLNSVKTGEPHVIDNIYKLWHKLHQIGMLGHDYRKIAFANNVGWHLYREARVNNDSKARDLLAAAYFIRLKERSIGWLNQMVREEKPPLVLDTEKAFEVISFILPLMKEFVVQDDYMLLRTALKHLADGRQLLGFEDEFSSSDPDPGDVSGMSEYTRQAWISEMGRLRTYYWELPFYLLSWTSYQIIEGEWQLKDKEPSIALLLGATSSVKLNTLIPWAIRVFSHPEKYPRMPISDWINDVHMRGEEGGAWLENTEIVLAVGILMIVAKIDRDKASLSEEEYEAAGPFVRFMKTIVERYGRNPHMSGLLGVHDEIDVSLVMEKVLNFLDGMNRNVEIARMKKTAETAVSPTKIEQFRTDTLKEWQAGRNIGKILEHYGADQIGDAGAPYFWVGLGKRTIKNGRVLFQDSDAETVMELRAGEAVNDNVWQLFRKIIDDDGAVAQSKANSLIEALDSIVADFPDISHAFIPRSMYFTEQKNLDDTGFFDTKLLATGVSEGGLYREKVLVVPIYNRSMKYEVVGLQLPGAIILQRRVDPSWFEGRIKIDVTEVDDANVAEVLSWRKPPGDPADPLQIISAKNDIIIEVYETINFKVVDHSKLTVISIERKFM